MPIARNLEDVRSRIARAAIRSGRKPEDIRLVAVTKRSEVPDMDEAIALGIDCVGENRVSVAAEKFPLLKHGRSVEKHMIGHLQTNKVKAALQLFDVIQSVDSIKLAKEIDKRALDAGRVMQVMIEVNISGEEQKHGIAPPDLDNFYNQMLKLTNIRVTGLMAMAPLVPAEETRPYFARMKQIFDRYRLKWLSMGMTNDFEVAIEEGSNMVRIGTAIFG